jgi:hypothetical protein
VDNKILVREADNNSKESKKREEEKVEALENIEEGEKRRAKGKGRGREGEEKGERIETEKIIWKNAEKKRVEASKAERDRADLYLKTSSSPFL